MKLISYLVLMLSLIGCGREFVRIKGVAEGLGVECDKQIIGEYESSKPTCLDNTDEVVSIDFDAKTVRCGRVKLNCKLVEDRR